MSQSPYAKPQPQNPAEVCTTAEPVQATPRNASGSPAHTTSLLFGMPLTEPASQNLQANQLCLQSNTPQEALVCGLAASPASSLSAAAAVQALAALAHETRLAIFRLLVQAGPAGMPASKLAEALAIAPSSLSFHLKELSQARLLQSQNSGRFVLYAVNFSAMQDLLQYLTENCCGGAGSAPQVTLCCSPTKGNQP